jgi:hypothetical protein
MRAAVIAALIVLSAASAGAPQASEIEFLLQRNEFCTATVDGCVDQDGRQIHANIRYAVSNVVCEQEDRMEADPRSWRCSFDLRQTRWMEGEQLGEPKLNRMTEIFDLISFTVRDGKKKIPQKIWLQRGPKQATESGR